MKWIVISALLGASGVISGAFGAHGLAGRLTPTQLDAWKTAAIYHLIHAGVILALALYGRATGKAMGVPAGLFAVGVVVFAGSIYALTLGGPRVLGPVTPLGGLLLVAGWVSLVFALR